MKNLLLLLVLLTQAAHVCGFNKEIVLPKKYKVLETFSGALTDEISFHIIYTKNKELRKKEQLIYSFNGYKTKKLATLDVLEGSIFSYHYKDNVLTIIDKNEVTGREKIRAINIFLTSGKIDVNDWQSRISKSDPIVIDYKTCLVSNSRHMLQVTEFEGKNKPLIHELSLKDNRFSNFFIGEELRFVKTDEFVPFGTTASYKMYHFNDRIYFTHDSPKELITKVFTTSVDCDSSKTTIAEFSISSANFKKLTSYFFKGFLAQLAINKEQGLVKIWNLTNNTLIAEFSINNEFIRKIMKGREFSTLKSFLNNNNIAISVNETKNGDLLVRIDYQLFGDIYNYNWFHLDHQMWMQQQMMRNNLLKGPNFLHFDNTLPFFNSKSDNYIQFLVSKEGELINTTYFSTVYKEINKKKFITDLLEERKLKMISFCFVKHKFRYVGYNKRESKLVFNQEQQR